MVTSPPEPHAPAQQRSRAKLARIVTACEELLTEKLFDQIAIAEIAARAKVAVGTIYSRFPAKRSLLPVLLERYSEQLGTAVDDLLQKLDSTASVERRCALFVAAVVEHHVRRRGLMRALTLYARANPEVVPERIVRERVAQYRAMARGLVGDDARIPRRQRLTMGAFGVFFVMSACRDKILFGDATLATPVRDTSTAQLKRQLTRALYMYLVGRAVGD